MQRQASRRFQLSRLSDAVTVLAAILVFLTGLAAVEARADTNDAAIVIDTNTGKVLYSDNPDAPRYPASLTKMMTLYLLFEAMDEGRVSLNTKIPFSKNAAAEPPTKLGIPAGGSITAETAIYALVTRSANDVATALGEYLGGSEDNFARMMTNKAHSLGMTHTTYRNAHGLPNSAQKTTARDQARLGIALRQHFPQYYSYFSTRSFQYGKYSIGNHNHLLGKVKGVDGIKTGYTNASGFNIATSAVVGNRSIVAVVMGGSTAASRDKWVTGLIEKYMSKASNGRGGGFVIARGASSTRLAMQFPKTGPIPYPRPVNDNAGVALAYAANDDAVPAATAALSGPQADLIANVPVPTERVEQPDDGLSVEDILDTADEVADSVGSAIITPAAAATAPDRSIKTNSVRPKSGWVVQVGTAATPEGAKAILDRTRGQAGGALDSSEPFALAYNSGGQQIYRARFGGFSDQEEAVRACRALKSSGVSCWASLQ
ncbi:D-alanyl-D-alanine carboxypeptidase [Martelella endophytica]|uniref:D-alanyl-D-alanine carboxypeptidase n=1 Tax=Martelella endophytica TaxID=1486262 RepID=A0A0D5LTR7_MAREN|nr:D-alanyl-D-alanine carboxypeptidase [Martelella endophytica]AJY47456.1 D-alanyl-D-alanine carboxypeptidase [Martelella endophytica]